MNTINWRRFEIANMLWRDVHDAERDYSESQTWINWAMLKLARSTYKQFLKGGE